MSFNLYIKSYYFVILYYELIILFLTNNCCILSKENNVLFYISVIWFFNEANKYFFMNYDDIGVKYKMVRRMAIDINNVFL